MKQTAKKLLSLLLCAAMLLSVAACGSSVQGKSLTTEQIEADVLEYLVTFVDGSATVTSLYQAQNELSDTQTEVKCQITYTANSGDGSGEVTLLYDLNGSAWNLTDCSADLETETVSAPVAAPETDVAQPETPAENAPETAPATEPETAPAETPAATPAPSAAPAAPAASAKPAESIGEGQALAGYTLTEMGSFTTSDEYLYVSEGLLLEEGNDSVFVYGANGLIGEYGDVENLYVDGYAKVVDADATNENYWGIVSVDGEQVLDCEAVWIEEISGSDRFVEVYQSTGECTQSDDYIICIRTYSGTGGLLLYTGDYIETYYTGSIKIFDLQTKAYVDGIELTNREVDISANNAMVCVEQDGTSTLYDANGEQIVQSTAYMQLSETMASFSVSGIYYIYDVNGERFTRGDSIHPLSKNGDYFTVCNNDFKYSLLDCDGNEVLPGMVFEHVYSFYDGVFSVQNAEGTLNQLIDLDGNVLYEGTDSPYVIYSGGTGWWYIDPSAGTETLVSPNGTIENIASGASNLKPQNAASEYIVMNTGEVLAISGNVYGLTDGGLVYASDVSGKKAIYDLFTGEAITEHKYTDLKAGDGYIYAQEGSTWHVFRADGIYK